MTIKNILKGFVPAALLMSLFSCKDRYPQPDFTQVTPVVELPVASLAGNGGGNSMSTSFSIQSTPSDYYIYVNYAAPDANSTDLAVKLAVDTATLGKFNRTNGTTYPLLPANDYSLANTIVIPAGQRKVEYHIKFTTTLIDPSATYALPLKITDASGVTVSGNFGTLVLLIGVKNIYDGTYSLKGKITRNSASGPDLTLGGTFKSGLSTSLKTLTANSNSFSQYWRDGSGVAGIDGLYLTVDPATNNVTVKATGNATLKNTTGYNNHYDPATKTFYLGFDWGTAPSTRIAVDTLVYTGP
ncbi:DUF1735 domain-containing protein [Mucilaginibacter robiniae]|uniref:DUF1735 domain-containing protein n=1 Tax=Mucilaginibacter robiniae TaxID=2728022 RepID=A0A7L5E2J8_9SPHI|nr:DUF1735 domain-containing protein [Mucilaginibacter robiniae]QJD97261.1 DUF1735 domain-containing protein [Mucilaginibacter robiniae]